MLVGLLLQISRWWCEWWCNAMIACGQVRWGDPRKLYLLSVFIIKCTYSSPVLLLVLLYHCIVKTNLTTLFNTFQSWPKALEECIHNQRLFSCAIPGTAVTPHKSQLLQHGPWWWQMEINSHAVLQQSAKTTSLPPRDHHLQVLTIFTLHRALSEWRFKRIDLHRHPPLTLPKSHWVQFSTFPFFLIYPTHDTALVHPWLVRIQLQL